MKVLDNKTAFVTGGGQGIGRGISLALAAAGANVVVVQRHIDKAEEVAAEIKALGRESLGLSLDVTDEASVKEGFQQALNRFSKVDILVNNAGVGGFEEGGEEEFDLRYDVNLKGVWRVTNQFIPHFESNKDGKIINIASVAGRKGYGDFPAYCASKAAVISLTQSLASALGPSNINVNAVCPGSIKTAQLEQYRDKCGDLDLYENIAKSLLLGRLPTPEDIGETVVFFASSCSKNITGQALNVDGGYFMN